MKLNTRLPREQDIADSLVKGFDRRHFQPLLLEWIIEDNHSFGVCEQGPLRQIFEYLNPLVKITDANISRITIRSKVLSAYEVHKGKVVAALKQSCGLIHVPVTDGGQETGTACTPSPETLEGDGQQR
jgi:hypothetical protein